MNKFLKIGLWVVFLTFGASLLIPTTFDCHSPDKKKQVIAEMHALNTSLKMFYIHVGRYPTKDEGLEILWNTDKGSAISGYRKSGYFGREIKDPWGNSYQYSIDGQSPNQIKLWSLGDTSNKGEPIVYIREDNENKL